MSQRVQLRELRPAGWSENLIARAIARSPEAARKALLVVPRTHWTGHECDLLAVDRETLKLVDLEIKISRADVKADAKKDKWWSRHWSREPQQREWPPQVWRHYYVVPDEVWTAALYEAIPATSGVLLLSWGSRGELQIEKARNAVPNPKAKPIGASAAIDLARLCGLRMWDALAKLETQK